jgi:hypothetical protein
LSIKLLVQATVMPTGSAFIICAAPITHFIFSPPESLFSSITYTPQLQIPPCPPATVRCMATQSQIFANQRARPKFTAPPTAEVRSCLSESQKPGIGSRPLPSQPNPISQPQSFQQKLASFRISSCPYGPESRILRPKPANPR